MIKLIVIISALILGLSATKKNNNKQNSFAGETEKVEIISTNPEYIEVLQSRMFNYNRTTTAYNLTVKFVQELGSDIIVKFQTYKFAKNEYRPLPLSFPINLCKVLEEDVFGSREMLKCGNFTKCPYNKGIYTSCNIFTDYSKFPANFPFGQYMIDIKLMKKNNVIFNSHWYVALKRA